MKRGGSNGAISLLLLLGVIFLSALIPVTTKLVEQKQDMRTSATGPCQLCLMNAANPSECDSICNPPPPPSSCPSSICSGGRCKYQGGCTGPGQCNYDEDCPQPPPPTPTSTSPPPPPACVGSGGSCAGNSSVCCSDLACLGGVCQVPPQPCRLIGSSCADGTACCSGGSCEGGVCRVTGGSVCVAQCAGKFCGDDGCGGSCGGCAQGSSCQNNQCVSTWQAPPSSSTPTPAVPAPSTPNPTPEQNVSATQVKTNTGGCYPGDARCEAYNKAFGDCKAQKLSDDTCRVAANDAWFQVEDKNAKCAGRGDAGCQQKAAAWTVYNEVNDPKNAGNQNFVRARALIDKASTLRLPLDQQTVLAMAFPATDCSSLNSACQAGSVARQACQALNAVSGMNIDCGAKQTAAYVGEKQRLARADPLGLKVLEKIEAIGDAKVGALLTDPTVRSLSQDQIEQYLLGCQANCDFGRLVAMAKSAADFTAKAQARASQAVDLTDVAFLAAAQKYFVTGQKDLSPVQTEMVAALKDPSLREAFQKKYGTVDFASYSFNDQTKILTVSRPFATNGETTVSLKNGVVTVSADSVRATGQLAETPISLADLAKEKQTAAAAMRIGCYLTQDCPNPQNQGQNLLEAIKQDSPDNAGLFASLGIYRGMGDKTVSGQYKLSGGTAMDVRVTVKDGLYSVAVTGADGRVRTVAGGDVARLPPSPADRVAKTLDDFKKTFGRWTEAVSQATNLQIAQNQIEKATAEAKAQFNDRVFTAGGDLYYVYANAQSQAEKTGQGTFSATDPKTGKTVTVSVGSSGPGDPGSYRLVVSDNSSGVIASSGVVSQNQSLVDLYTATHQQLAKIQANGYDPAALALVNGEDFKKILNLPAGVVVPPDFVTYEALSDQGKKPYEEKYSTCVENSIKYSSSGFPMPSLSCGTAADIYYNDKYPNYKTGVAVASSNVNSDSVRRAYDLVSQKCGVVVSGWDQKCKEMLQAYVGGDLVSNNNALLHVIQNAAPIIAASGLAMGGAPALVTEPAGIMLSALAMSQKEADQKSAAKLLLEAKYGRGITEIGFNSSENYSAYDLFKQGQQVGYVTSDKDFTFGDKNTTDKLYFAYASFLSLHPNFNPGSVSQKDRQDILNQLNANSTLTNQFGSVRATWDDLTKLFYLNGTLTSYSNMAQYQSGAGLVYLQRENDYQRALAVNTAFAISTAGVAKFTPGAISALRSLGTSSLDQATQIAARDLALSASRGDATLATATLRGLSASELQRGVNVVTQDAVVRFVTQADIAIEGGVAKVGGKNVLGVITPDVEKLAADTARAANKAVVLEKGVDAAAIARAVERHDLSNLPAIYVSEPPTPAQKALMVVPQNVPKEGQGVEGLFDGVRRQVAGVDPSRVVVSPYRGVDMRDIGVFLKGGEARFVGSFETADVQAAFEQGNLLVAREGNDVTGKVIGLLRVAPESGGPPEVLMQAANVASKADQAMVRGGAQVVAEAGGNGGRPVELTLSTLAKPVENKAPVVPALPAPDLARNIAEGLRRVEMRAGGVVAEFVRTPSPSELAAARVEVARVLESGSWSDIDSAIDVLVEANPTGCSACPTIWSSVKDLLSGARKAMDSGDVGRFESGISQARNILAHPMENTAVQGAMRAQVEELALEMAPNSAQRGLVAGLYEQAAKESEGLAVAAKVLADQAGAIRGVSVPGASLGNQWAVAASDLSWKARVNAITWIRDVPTQLVGELGQAGRVVLGGATPDQKVEEVVVAMEKIFDKDGLPKGLGCRSGLCGYGSDTVNYIAHELVGGEGKTYQLFQVQEQLRGIARDDSFQHAFSVVTVDGKKYLVDTTFSQFMSPSGVIMQGSNAISGVSNTNWLAQRLYKDGFVPLDDQTLSEYLRITASVRTEEQVGISATAIDAVKPLTPDYSPTEFKNIAGDIIDREKLLAWNQPVLGKAERTMADLQLDISSAIQVVKGALSVPENLSQAAATGQVGQLSLQIFSGVKPSEVPNVHGVVSVLGPGNTVIRSVDVASAQDLIRDLSASGLPAGTKVISGEASAVGEVPAAYVFDGSTLKPMAVYYHYTNAGNAALIVGDQAFKTTRPSALGQLKELLATGDLHKILSRVWRINNVEGNGVFVTDLSPREVRPRSSDIFEALVEAFRMWTRVSRDIGVPPQGLEKYFVVYVDKSSGVAKPTVQNVVFGIREWNLGASLAFDDPRVIVKGPFDRAPAVASSQQSSGLQDVESKISAQVEQVADAVGRAGRQVNFAVQDNVLVQRARGDFQDMVYNLSGHRFGVSQRAATIIAQDKEFQAMNLAAGRPAFNPGELSQIEGIAEATAKQVRRFGGRVFSDTPTEVAQTVELLQVIGYFDDPLRDVQMAKATIFTYLIDQEKNLKAFQGFKLGGEGLVDKADRAISLLSAQLHEDGFSQEVRAALQRQRFIFVAEPGHYTGTGKEILGGLQLRGTDYQLISSSRGIPESTADVTTAEEALGNLIHERVHRLRELAGSELYRQLPEDLAIPIEEGVTEYGRRWGVRLVGITFHTLLDAPGYVRALEIIDKLQSDVVARYGNSGAGMFEQFIAGREKSLVLALGDGDERLGWQRVGSYFSEFKGVDFYNQDAIITLLSGGSSAQPIERAGEIVVPSVSLGATPKDFGEQASSVLLGSGPAQFFEDLSRATIYKWLPGSEMEGVVPVLWRKMFPAGSQINLGLSFGDLGRQITGGVQDARNFVANTLGDVADRVAAFRIPEVATLPRVSGGNVADLSALDYSKAPTDVGDAVRGVHPGGAGSPKVVTIHGPRLTGDTLAAVAFGDKAPAAITAPTGESFTGKMAYLRFRFLNTNSSSEMLQIREFSASHAVGGDFGTQFDRAVADGRLIIARDGEMMVGVAALDSSGTNVHLLAGLGGVTDEVNATLFEREVFDALPNDPVTLSGFDYNNFGLPNNGDALLETRDILRQKYGLPPREMRFDNPLEYERRLLEIAKREKIRVATKAEFSQFFVENSFAGGVYMENTNTIVYDTLRDALERTATLEHELLHALQHIRYPSMPIEFVEGEAYMAGASPTFLTLDVNPAETLMTLINGSVNFFKRAEGLIPVKPMLLQMGAIRGQGGVLAAEAKFTQMVDQVAAGLADKGKVVTDEEASVAIQQRLMSGALSVNELIVLGDMDEAVARGGQRAAVLVKNSGKVVDTLMIDRAEFVGDLAQLDGVRVLQPGMVVKRGDQEVLLAVGDEVGVFSGLADSSFSLVPDYTKPRFPSQVISESTRIPIEPGDVLVVGRKSSARSWIPLDNGAFVEFREILTVPVKAWLPVPMIFDHPTLIQSAVAGVQEEIALARLRAKITNAVLEMMPDSGTPLSEKTLRGVLPDELKELFAPELGFFSEEEASLIAEGKIGNIDQLIQNATNELIARMRRQGLVRENWEFAVVDFGGDRNIVGGVRLRAGTEIRTPGGDWGIVRVGDQMTIRHPDGSELVWVAGDMFSLSPAVTGYDTLIFTGINRPTRMVSLVGAELRVPIKFTAGSIPTVSVFPGLSPAEGVAGLLVDVADQVSRGRGLVVKLSRGIPPFIKSVALFVTNSAVYCQKMASPDDPFCRTIRDPLHHFVPLEIIAWGADREMEFGVALLSTPLCQGTPACERFSEFYRNAEIPSSQISFFEKRMGDNFGKIQRAPISSGQSLGKTLFGLGVQLSSKAQELTGGVGGVAGPFCDDPKNKNNPICQAATFVFGAEKQIFSAMNGGVERLGSVKTGNWVVDSLPLPVKVVIAPAVMFIAAPMAPVIVGATIVKNAWQNVPIADLWVKIQDVTRPSTNVTLKQGSIGASYPSPSASGGVSGESKGQTSGLLSNLDKPPMVVPKTVQETCVQGCLPSGHSQKDCELSCPVGSGEKVLGNLTGKRCDGVKVCSLDMFGGVCTDCGRGGGCQGSWGMADCVFRPPAAESRLAPSAAPTPVPEKFSTPPITNELKDKYKPLTTYTDSKSKSPYADIGIDLSSFGSRAGIGDVDKNILDNLLSDFRTKQASVRASTSVVTYDQLVKEYKVTRDLVKYAHSKGVQITVTVVCSEPPTLDQWQEFLKKNITDAPADEVPDVLIPWNEIGQRWDVNGTTSYGYLNRDFNWITNEFPKYLVMAQRTIAASGKKVEFVVPSLGWAYENQNDVGLSGFRTFTKALKDAGLDMNSATFDVHDMFGIDYKHEAFGISDFSTGIADRITAYKNILHDSFGVEEPRIMVGELWYGPKLEYAPIVMRDVDYLTNYLGVRRVFIYPSAGGWKFGCKHEDQDPNWTKTCPD